MSLNYDFEKLIQYVPELALHLKDSSQGHQTIDFSDSKALKLLNKALVFQGLKLSYWEFDDDNLTPGVPNRIQYIKLVKEWYFQYFKKNIDSIIDIGTGSNLIYPLICSQLYNIKSVGVDSNKSSLDQANLIISKNNLADKISLRFQDKPNSILNGIIEDHDSFECSVCNPPFYKNAQEAIEKQQLKNKRLNLEKETSSFSGVASELHYPGGELNFLKKYVRESQFYKDNIKVFTSLVSDKTNLRPLQVLIKKQAATSFKLKLLSSNKTQHILVWFYQKENE
ncbi:MAG: RlmF-related methyltransferase [Flavobacteriaceae bacterium]